MAIPTFEVVPTIIDDADADTNWSGWNINDAKWDDELEFVLQGNQSRGLAPAATGVGGYGVDAVGGIDLSSSIILIWVLVVEDSYVGSTTGDIRVRVTSAASWTTNYNDYYVGTANSVWVGKGWRLIALDLENYPADVESSCNLESIERIGVQFNFTTISRKSVVFALDSMAYIANTSGLTVSSPMSTGATHAFTAATKTITRPAGSFTTDGFEVGDTVVVDGTANNDGEFTLATVGTTTMTVAETVEDESAIVSQITAYFSLEDIYNKDVTDDTYYGCVTLNPNSKPEINYPLIIGDNSGSNFAYFRSRGDIVIFADQPLGAPGSSKLTTVEDTGQTWFEVGDSTGEEDERVGFGGSLFTKDDTSFGQESLVGLSPEITVLKVFGTTFLDLDGGVEFSVTDSGLVTNTTFDGCGQVQLKGAESRNLIFTGFEENDSAAVLWSGISPFTSPDIKNSAFLANRNTVGSGHAIEFPTSGVFIMEGLSFTGNDYDLNFSQPGAGDLIVEATDSDPSNYDITGDGTSVSIINTVFLTVNAENRNGDPVEGVQTSIWSIVNEVASEELMNLDTDGDGEAQDTFNYPGSGVDIRVRLRRSTSGTVRYFPYETTGQVDEDGYTTTAILIEDPIASV